MANKLRVLIINGSWNTPIFSPKWINEYLYDSTLPEKVETELLVAYDKLSVKKYKIATIDIEIAPNRICFLTDQDDNEALEKIVEMVSKIVTLLPHTPLESFGINRQYLVSNNEVLLSSVPAVEKYNIINTSLKHGYAHQEDENRIINVSISEGNLLDKSKVMDFNFHYNTQDVSAVKKYLTIDIFNECKLWADKYISEQDIK